MENISSLLDAASMMMDQWTRSSLTDPLIAFPVYVLAGLLSSLFPCVYPLIPVTVGFLQKRAITDRGKWMHPLVYWLGTVSMYVILGLIASLGGGAFNTVMQNGVIITATGFLFLFLAFAIMDWFPLQFSGGQKLMEGARNRSGYPFTWLMGLGAGLVASACVAPALVTMLLFIAQTSSEGSVSILGALYGGGLSAAFGIGIGTPLLVAGILGARLPKSGGWMNYAKYVFAVIIAGAAVYQLEKGFRVLGYSFMDFVTIIIGLFLIAMAAILGLKPVDRSYKPALTRFIFALFALALGLGAVVRGVGFPSQAGGNSTTGGAGSRTGEISNGSTGNEVKLYDSMEELNRHKNDVAKETISDVTFYRDETFAHSLSRLTGKPLFIDFYADWCTNCKDFYNLIDKSPALKKTLQQDAVVLKIVDTDPVFARYMNDPRFPELNIGLPFFVILQPDGEMEWKTTNYRDTEGMIEKIQSASDP